MKKLIIAVCLIILTAAFEQKASSNYKVKPAQLTAAQSLDSLAIKLEHLNHIQRHEK
ncbi:hypothetical protein [Pedobacter sp. Leaf250]|uniref:hypothetical protein n=1 Tax=Pedobacter sp. Leaf250 TaxID=2876559 RepID=UPI001E456D1F|nr:hypothetical protein [Pedobacter sp. Leaf250]